MLLRPNHHPQDIDPGGQCARADAGRVTRPVAEGDLGLVPLEYLVFLVRGSDVVGNCGTTPAACCTSVWGCALTRIENRRQSSQAYWVLSSAQRKKAAQTFFRFRTRRET